MKMSIHTLIMQDRIIHSMLNIAEIEGWSTSALRKAVIENGFESQDCYRIFEGDVDQAFIHFVKMIDRHLMICCSMIDLKSLRTHHRIVTILLLRLTLLNPYRRTLKKIIKYQLNPLHISQTISLLIGSIDKIWYSAGDQATDFNYYSKRILLSGVYISTFLYWLQDTSCDYSKTQQFLIKRIDNVMSLPKVKQWFKSKIRFVL